MLGIKVVYRDRTWGLGTAMRVVTSMGVNMHLRMTS